MYFLDAPRIYIGPVWMNYACLQVLRILGRRLLFLLRPRSEHPDVAAELALIDRDGIIVIPNFFAKQEFEIIEQAFHRYGNSIHIRIQDNLNDTGVKWIHGLISDQDKDGRVIVEALAKNDKILKIVSGVMRHKIKRMPAVAYQQLEIIPGEIDNRDRECILHADRHFPTVKAFLYMNDNTVENGAYVYCPSSQKLTWARLKHEYEYSVREARLRHGKLSAIPKGLLERGRTIISPISKKAMRLQEKSIIGSKNTLVISNNMGFHRRGTILAGKTRKHIRLIFHYLEEPWYAPMVRYIAAFVRNWLRRVKMRFNRCGVTP
jgi:hypothetical protein